MAQAQVINVYALTLDKMSLFKFFNSINLSNFILCIPLPEDRISRTNKKNTQV